MARTALILTTSHDTLGDTGNPTGFYWEEVATPYWRLRDAGVTVAFASVRGGMPPADPGSDTEKTRTPDVERFRADQDAMTGLGGSARVGDIDPIAYDLIFLSGGHGTMWDFAAASPVGEFVARGYECGAVIGAVCHGPAGLLGATLPDGRALVDGRKICGFSNDEETAVGLAETVPCRLETRLRDLGGQYEKGDPFKPYTVRDRRLVTGQNPKSSARLADLLIEALNDTVPEKG